MRKYTTKQTGKKYTTDYKLYITDEKGIISPFHDIPLFNGNGNGIVSVINEIPRFENGKFEISKEEKMNPIKQDIKKNKLRFVANVFPFKGYPWNYGALPQTWENPDTCDPLAGLNGDNDPIDVIEIGKIQKKIGEVYSAKVLGCLGLLDEGECDWKIIVIDINDENASKINDIDEIDNYYPGLLEATTRWFRYYKVPDNKPENLFAFGGKFLNKDIAFGVIKEAHENWNKLINTEIGKDISKTNRSLIANQYILNEDFKVEGNISLEEGEVTSSVYEFFYVSNK
ncbi:inorganic pyrophosphatase [Hamiltosporidium tvaerminnensis]|uniref:inorganic diphosphatase n=2 Tax=Hamiltosporidium TaxID=1176354 RepID=A0A4Q9LDI5_9MICR|nr:inorganic pyrophosphatase [Hamiltosporidium magnivora]TBU12880.1 inorganic pyrophosphatase [Hamiltosporidium tvaerminnensis]